MSRGDASNDLVVTDDKVLCNDASGPYDGPVVYDDPGQYLDACADPDVVADDDGVALDGLPQHGGLQVVNAVLGGDKNGLGRDADMVADGNAAVAVEDAVRVEGAQSPDGNVPTAAVETDVVVDERTPADSDVAPAVISGIEDDADAYLGIWPDGDAGTAVGLASAVFSHASTIPSPSQSGHKTSESIPP